MDYYPNIKSNDILTYATTCILNAGSRHKANISYDPILHEMCRSANS